MTHQFPILSVRGWSVFMVVYAAAMWWLRTYGTGTGESFAVQIVCVPSAMFIYFGGMYMFFCILIPLVDWWRGDVMPVTRKVVTPDHPDTTELADDEREAVRVRMDETMAKLERVRVMNDAARKTNEKLERVEYMIDAMSNEEFDHKDQREKVRLVAELLLASDTLLCTLSPDTRERLLHMCKSAPVVTEADDTTTTE